MQGLVAPELPIPWNLTKVWRIPHSGYRSGQNALAGNDLYTPCTKQKVLRWLHPLVGQGVRVVCRVRFGLCWFGFSSSGFLGRGVLVLWGLSWDSVTHGVQDVKDSPDPQPHAQGDGKVTGVVVGRYENGREAFLRGTAGLPRGRDPSSPTLPTCPCPLPARPQTVSC